MKINAKQLKNELESASNSKGGSTGSAIVNYGKNYQ